MEANPPLIQAAQALAGMAADQRQLQGTVTEDHPVRYTTEGHLVIEDATQRNGMTVKTLTNRIKNQLSPGTLNMCRISFTGSTGTVTEILTNQGLQEIQAAQAEAQARAGQLDHILRSAGAIELTVRGSYDGRTGTGVYKHYAQPNDVRNAILFFLGGKWAGIRDVTDNYDFTLDIPAPPRHLRMPNEQNIDRWTLTGSITNVSPPQVSVTVFHFGPIT
jgi:hypothetical protein